MIREKEGQNNKLGKMQGQSAHLINFGMESVDELRKSINSTHETFLREDDPIKRADTYQYLCAYVKQFLYLVPHEKKFIFKETERILHQSAMNISDFDPREASIAFEYLGKYAQNILDQPWRQDFHTIKLTSGFYVHNISSQLKNAHELLVVMGYVHVDETTLKLTANLDEKKVKDMSRDAIVASQECLILSQIWQRVADQEPDYPLTTGEVFEFRRKYFGDTDTICRTMLLDIGRRSEDDKVKHLVKTSFVPVDKLIDYEDKMEVDGRRRNQDEVEIVQNVLHHTKLLHDLPGTRGKGKKEHIYDPVYIEREFPSTNGFSNPNYPHQHTSVNYPYHPGASAFVPLKPDSKSGFNTSLPSRDFVNSPLIPETVASFGRLQRMSEGQGYGYGTSRGLAQPLKQSKVSPEEVDWLNEETQDDRGRRVKEEPSSSSVLHWSEWERGQNPYPGGIGTSSKRRHTERPQPTSSYMQDTVRSRKPIMPSDMYPDDYFPPRIAKPTPVHSQQFQHGRQLPIPPRNDSCEEDMMNEALAYRSEINGQTEAKFSSGRNLASADLSLATSRQIKSDWETDVSEASASVSRYSGQNRRSENEKPSISSTEASSWEGLEGTLQRPKYFKEESRQDSTNYPHLTNGKKEAADIEHGATNGQPDSLNEVYYNHLLQTRTSEMEARRLDTKSTESQVTPDEIDANFNVLGKTSARGKEIAVSSEDIPKIFPWTCPHCTFRNRKKERICEVCCKSKDFQQETDDEDAVPPPPRSVESVPAVPKLYSSSPQNSIKPTKGKPTPSTTSSTANVMVPCPQCTLLNPSCRFECEACGNKLRNSNSPKSLTFV